MICKKILAAFVAIFSLIIFYPYQIFASSNPVLEKIPNSIITVSSGYIIAVDKQRQKLYVFKKNDVISKVFEVNCSTGKNQGSKQISGDAKTPNGIFFATRIIRNPGPPETYGTLAFPLDYPTIMDVKAGRNGTNIWIHGTSKPIVPFQSNGCVVLNDKDIHSLANYIQLNKTPVIIAETIQWVPQNQPQGAKDDLGKVLAGWTKGFLEGNLSTIDTLYLNGFQIKGKKRQLLIDRLDSIKSIKQHFILEPKDISILQLNNEAVILFDQITDINKDNSFKGSFIKLSLQRINNRWFILDEAGKEAYAKKADRIISSRTDSDSFSKDAVQKLIVNWSESWESGNMNNFRSCYASNFRAQGMNLNEWINHKISVRERSKNIQIRIDNIQISGRKNQATATFTQHYSSNLLKSKGQKRLDMKKINGTWKIYREAMR